MPAKTAGLDSRRPVAIRIAARHDSGSRLMRLGNTSTASASSRPCTIAARLVRAPASTLTLDRTISQVIGRPPSSPDTQLPTPWAISSRLAGVVRRSRSSRSTASVVSSAWSEATSAIATAAAYTAGLPIWLKSGVVRNAKKPLTVAVTGTCTQCDGSIIHGAPSCSRPHAATTPSTTAASGAGMPEARSGCQRLHNQSSTSDAMPTAMAPGCRSPRIWRSSEKVFSWSGWKNDISPS